MLPLPKAFIQRSLRIPLMREKLVPYRSWSADISAGTRKSSSRNSGQKKEERTCALRIGSGGGAAAGVEGGSCDVARVGRRDWGVRGPLDCWSGVKKACLGVDVFIA